MEEFHSKIYSTTPKNLAKYIESIRAPSIAINIRKKRLKFQENTTKLFNMSDHIAIPSNQNYPSPKKLQNRSKRMQESSVEFTIPEYSPTSKTPIDLKSSKNESISPSNTRELNHSYLSLVKLGALNEEKNKFDIRPKAFFNFPVSFKTKKGRKASKSVSSTLAFEKMMIPAIEPAKLENLIKGSNTPDIKVPNYIRHESYKAGFFLNKIDKVLGRIRVNRSRSSFNKYAEARNNLKFMIY